MGSGRAFFEPLSESRQGGPWTLGLDLDIAVGKVAHPADDPKARGCHSCRIAKPDTLNVSRNNSVESRLFPIRHVSVPIRKGVFI